MNETTLCVDDKDVAEAIQQSLGVLDDISAVMFTPQPEPPGDAYVIQGSGIMADISAVMFTPQPEPPGISALEMKTIGVLDNISALMFTPQPEPPGLAAIGATLDILECIMAVGFTSEAEAPSLSESAVDALGNMASILLISKKDDDQALVKDVLKIIDMMAALGAQTMEK